MSHSLSVHVKVMAYMITASACQSSLGMSNSLSVRVHVFWHPLAHMPALWHSRMHAEEFLAAGACIVMADIDVAYVAMAHACSGVPRGWADHSLA